MEIEGKGEVEGARPVKIAIEVQVEVEGVGKVNDAITGPIKFKVTPADAGEVELAFVCTHPEAFTSEFKGNDAGRVTGEAGVGDEVGVASEVETAGKGASVRALTVTRFDRAEYEAESKGTGEVEGASEELEEARQRRAGAREVAGLGEVADEALGNVASVGERTAEVGA